jgi:hypothetical protein
MICKRLQEIRLGLLVCNRMWIRTDLVYESLFLCIILVQVHR